MSKPTSIDLLYGLEPVIEPGEGSDGLEPLQMSVRAAEGGGLDGVVAERMDR